MSTSSGTVSDWVALSLSVLVAISFVSVLIRARRPSSRILLIQLYAELERSSRRKQ